ARPDLRAGAGTGGAGAAPRVAAPDARLAGAGSVGRTRARGLGHATPPGAIHPRAHRWGRRLGALTCRPARYAQRVRGSLGERRGRRHARRVPRGRRRVPATSPDGLLHAMTRAGIDEAWVSHLPSLFWRQPMEGNAWLYATAAREPRLKPVPALHPGLSGWEGALGEAADRAAPAGRC